MMFDSQAAYNAEDCVCKNSKCVNNNLALSEEQARAVAEGTECTEKGTLTENAFHNEDTGTWWIDLEMNPEHANDICNPACVVFDETGNVEINWRCTGALPPQ